MLWLALSSAAKCPVSSRWSAGAGLVSTILTPKQKAAASLFLGDNRS
jgi:hypothetical protein